MTPLPGSAVSQIADLVRALADIATVLRDADPDDKAEVYRQLRLTYSPKRKRCALKSISARTVE
ncbi:hypothetical protein [Micromonospora zamorensis]|uniref:hypothetical protein n=1 Tax=Micromonospora zamorensis TaxID=709883 RepID=UPI0037BAD20C